MRSLAIGSEHALDVPVERHDAFIGKSGPCRFNSGTPPASMPVHVFLAEAQSPALCDSETHAAMATSQTRISSTFLERAFLRASKSRRQENLGMPMILLRFGQGFCLRLPQPPHREIRSCRTAGAGNSPQRLVSILGKTFKIIARHRPGGLHFPGVLLTDVWISGHAPSKRRRRGMAITRSVEPQSFAVPPQSRQTEFSILTANLRCNRGKLGCKKGER